MATLAEIRAKLAEQEDRKASYGNNKSNNEIYPFWNIPNGTTALTRLLPDGDENNIMFWKERQIIKLPFDYEGKEIEVQVPCMDMYGKKCFITEEIKPWWNDEELKPLARKYYKKRSYIFQGFIVNNPLDDDDSETPIRRLVINKSIFDIIKSSLLDADMEDSPVDYDAGRDFRITKTKKGDYADYTTSAWSMKTRSLDDDDRAAIAEHGLYNLSDFLPNEPNEEQLEAIKEMFEASVNGDPYDLNRWGNFYRPYGIQAPEGSSSTPVSKPAPASKPAPKAAETVVDDSDDSIPFDVDESNSPEEDSSAVSSLKERANVASVPTEDKSSDNKPDPKAIIDMLRNRKKTD